MGLKLAPDVLAKVLAAAVGTRPRPGDVGKLSSAPRAGEAVHRHDDDRLPAGRLVVRLPSLVVVSEANRRDHWAARRRRAKLQAAAVALALAECPRVPLSVRVIFIRIGGKRFDPDNLAGGFKAVQDAVAVFTRTDIATDDRGDGKGERLPVSR